MKTTTNDLIHSIDINDDKTNCVIKIRLNDECKNGHEDFSITATFWEVGKVRNDRNMLYGGCCHDEILNVRPDLKIFTDLHLADFRGVPMHALANSQYFLKVGFDKTPITDPNFKEEFCNYYMIDPKHFEAINTQDKTYYKYLFNKLGIIKEWEKYAKKGIKTLEKLTGQKFESKATRLQNVGLTKEEIKDVKKKIKEGYYSSGATKERELKELKEKQKRKIEKLKSEANEKIELIILELNVMLFLIENNINIDNFIFYTHTKTGCFNWKSFEKKMTQEEFNTLLNMENLPAIKWGLNN